MEMDALHLISSLFPSHKSEFDLTSRQVRKFRKDSSLRTIKVFFHKNQTIPDRAARQCFKGQLLCVPLVFMLDMLDLLILRKLSGVEFSTLGVLLEQMNASGFHLCQGLCLMLTGVTQSSQIMLLLRVLCPEALRAEVVGGQHDHQHHVDVDGNKINELKRQIRVLKQVGYVSIMILLFINYHTYMLSIIEQEEQDY